MGDIAVTGDSELLLSVDVAAAAPIERIDIMNNADCVETLRGYEPTDLGSVLRITWHGAEYRGRGSNTHWEGKITFDGTSILDVDAVNRWNPERCIEIADDKRIEFDAVTSGNWAGVNVRLDQIENATVAVETNHVSGHHRLDEISLDDVVFDGGGLDRRISLRRLPNTMTECQFSATVPVALSKDADNALWCRITTADGHTAWSSPIYISRE